MIAPAGVYARIAPSLSSPSAMKRSPSPADALRPEALRVDPMAYDGSASHPISAVASIEVVVVLPCVPVTTTAVRPSITDCTAADLGHKRRPRSIALTTSGLSSFTAVDTTTVSTPSTCDGSWPTQQV